MCTNQTIKDYCSQVIARQSSLKAAQLFCSENDLKLSTSDLFLLVERFYSFIETGDSSFSKRFDEYIKLVDDERLKRTLEGKKTPDKKEASDEKPKSTSKSNVSQAKLYRAYQSKR